jgi:hypothetical protein
MTATTTSTTGLTIHATFDSSITNHPNAAAIEAMINRAIAIYESLFSDPITIEILFRYATTGPDGTPLSANQLAQTYTIFYTGTPWNTSVSVLVSPDIGLGVDVGMSASVGAATEVAVGMARSAFARPTVIVQMEFSGCGRVYLSSAMYSWSDDCSALSALSGAASISTHRVPGALVFRTARTMSFGGSPLAVSGWSEKYVSAMDKPLATSTSTLSFSDRNLYILPMASDSIV